MAHIRRAKCCNELLARHVLWSMGYPWTCIETANIYRSIVIPGTDDKEQRLGRFCFAVNAAEKKLLIFQLFTSTVQWPRLIECVLVFFSGLRDTGSVIHRIECKNLRKQSTLMLDWEKTSIEVRYYGIAEGHFFPPTTTEDELRAYCLAHMPKNKEKEEEEKE